MQVERLRKENAELKAVVARYRRMLSEKLKSKEEKEDEA